MARAIDCTMTDTLITSELDRLLWLPKSAVMWDRIQMELRRMAVSAVGEGRMVEPWELTDTHIGVPRRWGLMNYGAALKIEDKTIDVTKAWPELTWPDGWGYRPGQAESRRAMVNHFKKGYLGGLLEAFCGAGKTLIGLDVAANLSKPVLVLVHKDDLAAQWHDTLKTFWPSATAGHVQGSNWDFRGKHMVTAMAQTLYSRKDSSLLDEMYRQFGMVIFDEGHRYPAETFEYVMRSLPMRLRMGVSATWRRRDGLDCIWEWHVGEIVHRMSGVRLTGTFVQVPWKTRLTMNMFKRGPTLIMAHLINAISKNVPYNVWLAQQAFEGAKLGRRILVCSDRVEQLLDLQARIRGLGFSGSVGLYVGGIPSGVTASGKPRVRKPSKSELESAKSCDIMLATYGMMAEGTDVPELDTLILATPRSDIEQVVGRIQRPKDGKRPLLVVDPVFGMEICVAMANKRRAIYDSLEFKEHRPDKES